MKIGVFGGSFNPPHLGHLNAVQTVGKKLGLELIYIVPNYQNPLKADVEGPTPEQRLDMVKSAAKDWGENIKVEDLEIRRGGPSYTLDTLKELNQRHPKDDLYLILGMDAFESFSDWRKPKAILEMANLVVTSRPGFDFPSDTKELPKLIQEMVEEFDFNFVELTSGKSVQFVKLADVEVSSSQIRKWLRIGKTASKYIPLAVENYIRDNKLYSHFGEKIGDFAVFTEFCADQLFAKKAIGVRGFDLRSFSAPSEFALVASGTSTKHTTSLAENLARSIKEEFGVLPLRVEGIDEGRWVVLDYGSLMVHVFYDYVRNEYSLEKLWREAKDMGLLDKSLKK